MLLSADTSGFVNLWDKRNLQHSLQLQLPPASTYALSHSNQLLTICKTTLNSVNLDSQSIEISVEVRDTHSVHFKLPFSPSLFVPFEDSHYLMSNETTIQLMNSSFQPSVSYSNFSHITDLGTHGKTMLTPIVEVNECLLHVSGLFFNTFSGSVSSTEEPYSMEDPSILQIIRNASVPVDPLSPESLSLLESLATDSIICESDGDSGNVPISDDVSLVVSEESTVHEDTHQGVILTSPLATHQKACMARLSQSVVKSALHAGSSTPRLSVIPPRSTFSRSRTTDTQSPVIPRSSSCHSSSHISHPSTPSSTPSSLSHTLVQSVRTTNPSPNSPRRSLSISNQTVISTLSRRRSILQRLLRNQDYWRVIDSITDPVLLSTCIDVMQTKLVPTKSEEYLIVSNILKRCLESEKAKLEMVAALINSVVLSGLRLLRRIFIMKPKNNAFGNEMASIVDKLINCSFGNDLIKFYLRECSQLLLS